MVKKAVWILSVIVMAAVSTAIVLRNPEQVAVRLTPGWETASHNKGVVLLTVFFLGVLATCIAWSYFGIKAYLRERRLERREKRRQTIYEQLLKARSCLAAGDWEQAQHAWEQILKRDPANVVARIELSRCLEAAGDLQGALKTIDAARAAEPGNIEVLFRGAELNLALDNKTAAVDNLALTLYSMPTPKGARLARDLSEELERIDDALEYQEKLDGLGGSEPCDDEARARLRFKKIVREAGSGESAETGALRQALRTLLKQHPHYPPALERLAEIQAQEGKVDEAAQLLVEAAKHGGSVRYWQRAAELWIEHNMAGRAVAAARTAASNAEGSALLDAELFLIRLYLSLGMLDQAEESICRLPARLADSKLELQGEQLQRYLALQGLCAHLSGRAAEAADAWRKLLSLDDAVRRETRGQIVNG